MYLVVCRNNQVNQRDWLINQAMTLDLMSLLFATFCGMHESPPRDCMQRQSDIMEHALQRYCLAQQPAMVNGYFILVCRSFNQDVYINNS